MFDNGKLDGFIEWFMRKYADLFNRSPGNILSLTAQEVLKLDSVEKCARACHKSTSYQCLSFDYCPQSKDAPCKLHTVHYPNSKTRENIQVCIVSSDFGEDIAKDNMEDNNLCIIVTRKYADLFNRSPGNVLSLTAQEVLKLDSVEKCARACHKSTSYQCLSFDYCPQSKDAPCKLHTVHYPNSKTRENIQVRDTNCGHYFRKFSTEFRKYPNKRYLGSTIPPITNATLEECSKACMEYKKGTCFGYDFCQDVSMLATSCLLLDSDPAKMKASYSEVCTNFLRSEAQFTPRPYSNGYAGGIGFLCFVVGLVAGALVIFAIAYIRVKRH
ncbi:uncharacterized protein [Parasteatoda tepidariorum]|uniref:uncharacterized protein n=1 Tax=Parasteatoda tepidariorum TaxID=114398 RepID=UPI0039BCF688